MGTALTTNLSTEQLRAILAERESEELAERKAKREAYQSLRDSTTEVLTDRAIGLFNTLKGFKSDCFDELETLYKLLQEHSERHADGKGSFTVQNELNTRKITFKRHDNTTFDERSTQAERHILDFIDAQFPKGNATSKLVRSLLERKKGQLDRALVLKLIGMKDDFDNVNWRKGIELLQESIVPAETKYYAQFWKRDDEGAEWQGIVLDFARI